jgi:hypothetical protein
MSESSPTTYRNRVYLGCDPGSTGAFALVWENRVSIFGIPLSEKPIGGTAVDDAALWALAQRLASLSPDGYIQEHTWGVRGQGGGSQYKFGDTAAACRCYMLAAGVPMAKPVSSQRWTAALRVGSDKMRHVAKAIELFPEDAELFTPKRGVRTLEQCKGNADAALIAEYGRRFAPC